MWQGLPYDHQQHRDRLFGRGGVAGIVVQDQQPGPERQQDQGEGGRFQEGEAEVQLHTTKYLLDPGREGEQL